MDEEDQNNEADDHEDQKCKVDDDDDDKKTRKIRPMMMAICDCVYSSFVQSCSKQSDGRL